MPHRDWYLATLGIVRYVPRGSVVAEDIEEIQTPVAPSAHESRAALRQLLADDTPAHRSAPAPAASPGARAPSSLEPINSPEPVNSLEPVNSPELMNSLEPINSLEPVNSLEPINRPEPIENLTATRQPAPSAAASGNRTQNSLQTQSDQAEIRAVESATQQKDEDIEVRLAVWQPAPDVFFFDSLRPAAQPSIQMARLVSNITAALGHHAESGAMPQLLDWPPARGRTGGGLEAARTMVSAFCDARFSDNVRVGDSISLVLILGDDAARLLVPDLDVPEGGSPITLRWRGRDAVVATSLSDMLGNPTMKRRIWQAIAPFARQGQ